MTRQEALNIIASLNETLDKMSDEELYAHMMKTSPSFRATIKAFNEFVDAKEHSTDGDFTSSVGVADVSPESMNLESFDSSYGKMKKCSSVTAANTGVEIWNQLVA